MSVVDKFKKEFVEAIKNKEATIGRREYMQFAFWQVFLTIPMIFTIVCIFNFFLFLLEL